jgi:DNA-binding XRE family transcriptional regulator
MGNCIADHMGIDLGDVDIAKALKEIRTGSKMTQAQMARLLGCGLRSYCRYEAGTRIPPTTVWLRAADLRPSA